MKHKIPLIFLLILISIAGLNAQNFDTLNVYYQALKFHFEYWDNFHKERLDLVTIPKVYFIEQDHYTTDSLPSIINGHQIDILTSQDIYNKTSDKKGIKLIAIRPARWDKGRLVINVIDFEVSRKKKQLYYSNGGGSSFQVTGDKPNKDLKLIILSQGGL
jgi:hypothetical protein